MEEARELAERYVAYFAHIVRESHAELWEKGLKTANEWKRLIDADSKSDSELSALLGIIRANSGRTMGWSGLASGVYSWVESQGYPVTSREECFSRWQLVHGDFREAVAIGQANRLLKYFEQNNHDEPAYDHWIFGMATAKEWLKFIQSQDTSGPSVTALLDEVHQHCETFGPEPWVSFEMALFQWCSKMGIWHSVADTWQRKMCKNIAPKPHDE